MSNSNPPPPPQPPAGWYRDPTGQGDARYWDGAAWTDSVSRSGVTLQVAVPPEHLHVPPTPGSEYRSPAPPPQPAPQYVPPAESRPPQRRSGGSGILVGLVVAVAVVVGGVLLIAALTGDDDEEDPTGTTITIERPDRSLPDRGTTDPPADTGGG